MPTIELSEEVRKRLNAFKKVIEVIMKEDTPKTESDYVELVLSIGLEKMLLDVIPKEEMLQETMSTMFSENPEFVSNFVASTIEKGSLIKKEERKKTEESWRGYIG